MGVVAKTISPWGTEARRERSAHSLGFRQDRYIGTTIDGGLRGHHLSSIGAVALYRDDFSTKPPFGCFVGLQGVGTGKSALNVDAEGRGPR
jgi:hypothetical protein